MSVMGLLVPKCASFCVIWHLSWNTVELRNIAKMKQRSMMTHQGVKPILPARPRSRTPPTNGESSIFKEQSKQSKLAQKRKSTGGIGNAVPKLK